MLMLHEKDVLTEDASKGQAGALTTTQVSCFGSTFSNDTSYLMHAAVAMHEVLEGR